MIPNDLLVQAYSSGVFPMGMDDGGIEWFSPQKRGILPLDTFHVPHGLRRTLKKDRFVVTINQSFGEVIRQCAERERTWINAEIIESFENLHASGLAHSVEARLEGRLVGGLYGVALRGAFFGESMFHSETDASKVALHALVGRMRERGFALLDLQWVTPHLATFGAVEVPRSKYLRMLASSMKLDCRFVD